MVWLIARKEMTEQIRDGRFKLATLIVLLLSLASLIAGWQSYREFKAQHQLAEEAEWQRWLNQGEKSSHSAAHYGIFVFKPQMPLSIIDKGIDPYVGVTARLEVHTQNIFQFRPVEDSTSLRRFGEVTVASTAQILVPLMIVILTFNSFAGERQQGTLRQILSIGVKSRSLIIGKVIGSSLPLFIILIPLSMVCSVVILANTLTDSVSNNILKLLVMTLGYIVYFTIFIGMGLAVSAKSVSSRQALIVLLFFWFINCLMAPP
ncbi:MAG: ABC transporter permease subunit, partial [Blastocatellia bacterium]|nr:ABC transporter permease subunit [Blastocatellia bacterium]